MSDRNRPAVPGDDRDEISEPVAPADDAARNAGPGPEDVDAVDVTEAETVREFAPVEPVDVVEADRSVVDAIPPGATSAGTAQNMPAASGQARTGQGRRRGRGGQPGANPESVSDASTASVAPGGATPETPSSAAPTSEPLASRLDGQGPDRVAIGVLAGIILLLVICVIFSFAAR